MVDLIDHMCFVPSSPDLASVTSFHVEENDFLVIATDGLWDNLPDATILGRDYKHKNSK